VAAPYPFERLFFAGHRIIILEQVYSAIAFSLRALRGQAMASGPEWPAMRFRNFVAFVRFASGYALLLLKLGVCCKSLI
jgi:hypothetical protein